MLGSPAALGPGPELAAGHRHLARELPAVSHARLGPVTPAAWRAAAARLEAAVPRLTGGQIVAGMARLIAMLHDDETLVEFPGGPYLALDAQWVGSGLYLLAVPAADRALLGARLLAFDGHPVAQVLARAGTVVDARNPQLLSNSETGALDDLSLLRSLGLAASTASATLTVMTREGTKEDVRLRPAAGSGFITWPDFFVDQVPGLAHVPLPATGKARPGHRPGRPVHRLVGHRGRAIPEAGRSGADGSAACRSPRYLGQRADIPAAPLGPGHPVHDDHGRRGPETMGNPGRRHQADAGPDPGRR
jgi:hypothetical protein